MFIIPDMHLATTFWHYFADCFLLQQQNANNILSITFYCRAYTWQQNLKI
jgi:hypothetical protein